MKIKEKCDTNKKESPKFSIFTKLKIYGVGVTIYLRMPL